MTDARWRVGEVRDGDIPLGEPPIEEEAARPPLALVRDPLSGALERIGLDALRSVAGSEMRDVLLRLGEEAAALNPLDVGLLEVEAARRLTQLGEPRADALVAAAIAHGRKAKAEADAAAAPEVLKGRDLLTVQPFDPRAVSKGGSMQERQAPILRSLAELLTDPGALKPPETVVPRLAYRGRVALIAGREKLSGKSTFLTAGAAALTHGTAFLGERCTVGHVLWITADQEHAGEIAQRAVRFGADPTKFHVLWPREPFADLQAAVERVAPALVVIDSLANFVRVEDPHSAGEWPGVLLPLVSLARDRDLAVAIVHHANKTEGRGYRDSSAIGACVDVVLELQADTTTSTRRNAKVIARWPAAANFAVELVGDCYRLVAGSAFPLDAQVVAFIGAHPRCTLTAIRAGVGKRAEDVDAVLDRLLKSGVVVDDGTDSRHAYIAQADQPDAR